tara:strand:- start:37 stop:495 length:459 start_codon:yes stop_codon:yes gene_type:complete
MKTLNKQEIKLLKELKKAYEIANSINYNADFFNSIEKAIQTILKSNDKSFQLFIDYIGEDFNSFIKHYNRAVKEYNDIEKAKKELENNQYTEIRNLRKLNIEYFKLNENSNAVYFINDYLKGYNEYSISRFDDMNSERFVKPNKKVFINFTF